MCCYVRERKNTQIFFLRCFTSQEVDIADVEAEDAEVTAAVVVAVAVEVDAVEQTLHIQRDPRRSRSSILESTWTRRSESNTAEDVKVGHGFLFDVLWCWLLIYFFIAIFLNSHWHIEGLRPFVELGAGRD